jgi:lipoprotein-anchoring transpeptidase ErfK/SrfK
MYNRIPTEAEQRRVERPLGSAGEFRKLPSTLAAHEDLAVTGPIAATEGFPDFLSADEPINPARLGLVARSIPLGSMLSFNRAFDIGGRVFLLSPDNTFIPADRVRRFQPSSFRGTSLGGDTHLPIAWVRRVERMKWRRDANAIMMSTNMTFPARSFVELTGAAVEQGKQRWLETREVDPDQPGARLFIAERDATIVSAEPKRPIGVGSLRKWVIVRITQGTLVAYEGLTPVYSTLISPGSGGVPVAGRDPVAASTTPLGVYYVTFKDRAATMSPDKDPEQRKFWIADVPHTQYFNPPFALHAAYWHERFGEPTSAGCINLSPIDAEALFRWSDPPVPDHWQGATGAGAPENGPSTAVVVRR